MNLTIDEKKAIFKRYKGHPERVIKEILKVEYLTEKQIEIIQSVWNHKRTVVPSGHSLGKSFLAGAIVVAFLTTHKNSMVITTAPTFRQVKDILWKNINEFAKSNKKAIGYRKLGVLEMEMGNNWFAVGFATQVGREEVSAVRMQGYHAKHILAVLDEASGVPMAVWGAIDGILSSDGGRCLAIGNPSERNNSFHKAILSGKWNVIKLSALEHPNIIKRKEVVPGAVSYHWVSEKIDEWCEEVDGAVPGSFEFDGKRYKPNGLFKWKVLGEFPDSDDNTLFDEATIKRAFSRGKIDGQKYEYLGVDVARFGDDKTVLCRIKNGAVTFRLYTKKSTVQTTKIVKTNSIIYSPKIIVIDADGVGGGVFDQLKELKIKGLVAFHGGSRAQARIGGKRTALKFVNLRAQAYYYLSKDINKLSIKTDDDLMEELLATDMYIKNGIIHIIAKEDIKAMLSRSPDKADALAYANFGRYLKNPDLQVRKRL